MSVQLHFFYCTYYQTRAPSAHHKIQGRAGGGREGTSTSGELANREMVGDHPKNHLKGADLEMTYKGNQGWGGGSGDG